MTVFVIPGNHKQFMDYCHENDLNPNDSRQAVDLGAVVARGRIIQEGDTLVYVGTWACRHYHEIRDIYRVLRMCDRDNVFAGLWR